MTHSPTVNRDWPYAYVDHTIHGLEEVTVILPSGKETKASVTSHDPGTDIALLKLPTETPSAALADDSSARPGEIVLSIGRRGTEGLAATYGLISAIGGAPFTSQAIRSLTPRRRRCGRISSCIALKSSGGMPSESTCE